MKNQQLINQIEIRIIEIQNDIQHWKETINQHEKTLSVLIKELTQIKENIKEKK